MVLAFLSSIIWYCPFPNDATMSWMEDEVGCGDGDGRRRGEVDGAFVVCLEFGFGLDAVRRVHGGGMDPQMPKKAPAGSCDTKKSRHKKKSLKEGPLFKVRKKKM